MLAAPLAAEGKWLVLVDSDQSGYDETKYREERTGHALSPRLRFTVAHELGHLLRFKTAANIKPARRRRSSGKDEDLVDTLENEADCLSPLLLVAENALEKICEGEGRLMLGDWVKARNRWAVSREVLVQRLNLLAEFDRRGFRFKPRMRNLVVGLGEWLPKRQIRLLDWPKPFRNLDGGWVPQMLIGRGHVSHETFSAAFPSPEFCLNGGDSLSTEELVWVGTEANPKSEQLRLRLEVERAWNGKSGKFLYQMENIEK